MNIGSIVWPTDAKSACTLYLEFAVRMIVDNGIRFPNSLVDPIGVAKRFASGTLPRTEYDAAAVAWWDYLDTVGGVREFENRDALTARLALCLLCARPEEAPDLGEHLSWLLQIMHKLGLDTRRALQEMETHFGGHRS